MRGSKINHLEKKLKFSKRAYSQVATSTSVFPLCCILVQYLLWFVQTSMNQYKYRMFVLSSSDRRQQGFTTYLGPLKKNCCPNFLPRSSAKNSPNLCSLHSQLAKAAKKRTSKKHMVPYVNSKFVRQEAVGIYYTPWPAKKLLPKICTQACLPETAKNCAACTANQSKLEKNKFQTNILYFHEASQCQKPML